MSRSGTWAWLWLLAWPLLVTAQEVVILDPHGRGGRLYKGQLHCHSDRSDGRQSPEELFRVYGQAGYDFVCLSDHLLRTEDPDVAGVTWIPASEIHTLPAEEGDTWGGHHINGLGIKTAPRDGWERSGVEPVLARIAAEGGLAMANHPRIRNRWDPELLLRASPLQLISVFNTKGYLTANNKLQGAGGLLYATQFQWDRLLTDGRTLWGVAADDCHDVTDPEQFDGGWVRVRSASSRADHLLTAIREGDLYACRGRGGRAPALRVWSERGADGGWRVTAESETPGVELRWISGGRVVDRGPGPHLTLTVSPNWGVVRAEAHDGQDPDRVCYSQPLRIVSGPRLTTKRRAGRWELQLRDQSGAPVRTYPGLDVRVGTSEVRLPAGETNLVLPEGVGAQDDEVVPLGDRGWPAVRLGS